MEDEFICILPEYEGTINASGNKHKEQHLLFSGVFDGHGGQSISRYLRQNLYAYFQSALTASSSSSNIFNFGQFLENNDTTNGDDYKSLSLRRLLKRQKLHMLRNSIDSIQPPSVDDCVHAIQKSLQMIDDEVQAIRHWSYQGSTAVCILLHYNYTSSTTTIISVNIGDSRAVLSRDQTAIDLTTDHKPNHPNEKSRIEKLGGNVTWMGDIHPKTKRPIPKSGIYRLNGNLALSRAIGDRAEKPWITSQPDIELYKIQSTLDSFVVIASDGLWDVMSSQEVVDFIHDCMIRYELLFQLSSKQKRNSGNFMDMIVKDLIAEAFKRGSMDNITIVIIWLEYNDLDNG